MCSANPSAFALFQAHLRQSALRGCAYFAGDADAGIAAASVHRLRVQLL